jgi:hypothetical protein
LLQTNHSQNLSASHHKICLYRIQFSFALGIPRWGRLMSRLFRIGNSEIDMARSDGRNHATRLALILA